MLPLTMLPGLATTEKVKPALPALVGEESEFLFFSKEVLFFLRTDDPLVQYC